MNQVCIIILTYNNIDDTKECLYSLRNLKGIDFNILVVDNGSSDNTIEEVNRFFPETTVISLPKNLGVPSGFNQGIIWACQNNFEYICLLNNDTTADVNMLTEMLEVASLDSRCGLVMPKIMKWNSNNNIYDRNQIWSDGGYFRKFPPAIMLKDNRRGIDFSLPRKIQYAPACGILIHKRAFESVGVLDPSYFFFYEDWDFCERLHKVDLNIWCAPKAIIWHKVSRTTKSDTRLYWKVNGHSAMRFFAKHYSLFMAVAMLSYIIFRDLLVPCKIKYLPLFIDGMLLAIKEIKRKGHLANVNNLTQ